VPNQTHTKTEELRKADGQADEGGFGLTTPDRSHDSIAQKNGHCAAGFVVCGEPANQVLRLWAHGIHPANRMSRHHERHKTSCALAP
jgi:hypothetical protein